MADNDRARERARQQALNDQANVALAALAVNPNGLASLILPTDKQERKDTPICSGVLDYFPAAIAEVARVSKIGNDQHNPGQPMHWARGKSNDHADCVIRHTMERGTLDTDGARHSAKAAWRALAMLQEELEAEGAAPGRASRFPVDVCSAQATAHYGNEIGKALVGVGASVGAKYHPGEGSR